MKQLRQGKAPHIDTQGELDTRDLSIQRLGHIGQGGEIEIRRQRPYGHQGGDHHHQAPLSGIIRLARCHTLNIRRPAWRCRAPSPPDSALR